jgi:hypothetical protein
MTDIEAYLERLRRNGYSAPAGTYWADLFRILRSHQKAGELEPRNPLILGGAIASHKTKHARFREHLMWAYDNGCLDVVMQYLSDLEPDAWNRAQDDEDWNLDPDEVSSKSWKSERSKTLGGLLILQSQLKEFKDITEAGIETASIEWKVDSMLNSIAHYVQHLLDLDDRDLSKSPRKVDIQPVAATLGQATKLSIHISDIIADQPKNIDEIRQNRETLNIAIRHLEAAINILDSWQLADDEY